jgi:hypothetical protein
LNHCIFTSVSDFWGIFIFSNSIQAIITYINQCLIKHEEYLITQYIYILYTRPIVHHYIDRVIFSCCCRNS